MIEFEETLVIEVKRLPGRKAQLSKPPTALNFDQYCVKKNDEGRTIVKIVWPAGSAPKCLEFQATEDSEPITGIGFWKPEETAVCYSKKGRCGGCFRLREDIPPNARTVLVDNDGDTRKEGFHFGLWFNGEKHPFDPQIYNEGTVRDGWERKIRHVFRRLRRLLTGWLR